MIRVHILDYLTDVEKYIKELDLDGVISKYWEPHSVVLNFYYPEDEVIFRLKYEHKILSIEF